MFRDRVEAAAEAPFSPAAGSYHLYIARNCPGPTAALTRHLSGLTDVVTLDVVDPWREDDGWDISPEQDGCTPNTVNGAEHLREG